MEDEIKKVEETLDTKSEPEKFLHKIEVVMLPTGDIGLRTTSPNKAICKAMLAGAVEILDQPQQRQVVVPRMGLMPGGKNIGRG